MKETIRTLGRQVKDKKITWDKATIEFNRITGKNISKEAFRSRYRDLGDIYVPVEAKEEPSIEYETNFLDGTLEAQKIVEYNREIFGDKTKLLEYLGYNPKEWEFIYVSTSLWQQHTKEQTTKQLYAVKYKIKPIVKQDLSTEEYLEIAKQVFEEEIKPIPKREKEEIYGLDNDKLLELPGIELHLGKMAWSGDTGQDYDKDIAQFRFYTIVNEIIKQQEIEKCGTCLLCIGNDFFNSDTVNATTTKGTPQTNDLRWKKMFNLGLEMYLEMIEELRTRFNCITVRLQSGNHDKMSSFYLYTALSCYYKDDLSILFSNDYKDVQCYKFGKCGIWYSHGDSNLKRLIKSIPAEFYEEWGSTIYRELHLGHLHKEVVVDDDSGMITRRVGSPTGTDQWHYEERFIGGTQKYQTFVWDRDKGLQNIKYINFESNSKKKVKIKEL